MRLFSDLADLQRVLGGIRRWDRTAQAITHAPAIPAGVYSCVGDTLTFLRDASELPCGEHFTGHRRYLQVLAPLSGTWRVEVADKADLQPLEAYSDLSDRETFSGAGTAVDLRDGTVLVLDVDQAYRIPTRGVGDLVVAHVSVEGAIMATK